MTDQELIERLQQKSVGELTPDEIEAIRARWVQSPELRQALVDHLRLESVLVGSLGAQRLDVDAILATASQKSGQSQLKMRHWLWLVGLCLLIATSVGVVVIKLRHPAQNPLARQAVPEVKHAVEQLAAQNNAVPEIDEQSAHQVAQSPPSNASSDVFPEPKPAPVVDSSADPALAAIAPNEPWSTAFSRDVAPWPANSPNWTASFKAAGHDELSDFEARRWLAPVDGQPCNWSTDNIGNPHRRIARFQGLAKLRAPWPRDAILRMTPFEVSELTLFFWNGPSGVAFRFYTKREPHLWAAFEISRENSSPTPTRWGLLTTDNGAYHRSTAGSFDIRHQDKDLILVRGGIVLMSVPFAGPPAEVFVEGQFRLRGFSMHRGAHFPANPDSTHSVIISGPAATAPWAISPASPANLTSNDDGSVTLTVDSRDKKGFVSLPFGWILATQDSPRSTGLFEVIVCVDSADPGTGIYLGDRNGRPTHRLGFFRDGSSRQVTFGPLRPDQTHTEANFNLHDFPPPYLSKPGWFKLTAGLGTFHIQTSGDGRHWGHITDNPVRDLPGAVASMGLYGLPGPTARSLRVRSVQIRELNGITDLADAALRKIAPSFSIQELRNSMLWRHRVLESQPAGADTMAWFTTCAVEALSQGPPKGVAMELLQQLVAVGFKSNLSIEQKRQLLDDACSLSDLYDEGSARTLGKWYEELGWQLAEAGDQDPLSKTRPAWLCSPIWTMSKMRYVWEKLHSHQILQALYRRDWPTAWRISQTVSYWNLAPHPDLHPTEHGEVLEKQARWAKSVVADAAPQIDDGTSGVMPNSLRHPLMPVLNKEAYNTRADLQSALSSGSYEDACRILISMTPNDGSGLLPDVEDRDLFVSMQTAVSIARNSHPGFATTLSDKFEPLGNIRVTSAIHRRDLSSLEAATLQFMGTDAARRAHVWMGDRAMSAGQFDAAEQHFRQALLDADANYKQILEPRMLLARALSGQLSAPDWTATRSILTQRSLDINGKLVSAAEFESLITQILDQQQSRELLRRSEQTEAIPFPQSAYKLELRSHFDGHPGNNPGKWEFRFGDPIGRQFATANDDQRIYLSNRFQVNAYSSSTGQQVWAQGLGSEQGETYAMPFTPMKPLLTGDKLYVRRLTKAGAELACLNSSHGNVIWSQRPFQSALSDPVLWNGKLFALASMKIDDDTNQVVAAWFDAKTGDLASHKPLFRLREIAERQASAQLTIQGHQAVCVIAGTTACFNSQGETSWVRRHLIMLKSVDELYDDQRVSVPLITGDKVIVSAPGVRVVSCLELGSGRIAWQTPVTRLRGIIGLSGSRLLIDTDSSLTALDKETGQIAWNYEGGPRLEGIVMHGDQVIVTRRATFQNPRSKPLLVWLSAQTGEELAQTMVQVQEHDECQIGPLFAANGRWWSLIGKSWKEPRRELQELVPVSASPPRPFSDFALRDWAPSLADSKLAEIEAVVPGWFPVSDYRDRLTLHPGETLGETFFLISRLDSQHEFHFTHQLQIPDNQKSTLHLRVANRPGHKWKLTICHGDQILSTQLIEDTAAQRGWRNLSIDLGSLEATSAPLRLIQSSVNNQATEALWKQATVIVE